MYFLKKVVIVYTNLHHCVVFILLVWLQEDDALFPVQRSYGPDGPDITQINVSTTCTCMYVHVFIRTYVCMYVNLVHTYMYVHMFIPTYLHTYVS